MHRTLKTLVSFGAVRRMRSTAALAALGVVLLACTLAAQNPSSPAEGAPARKDAAPAAGQPAPATRTRAEVLALIDSAGKAQPDWWNSVQLNYPQTLDLTWTDPPRGAKWEPQKYLGQYIISVVNPNPSKWKECIKLLHHVLKLNENDPQKVGRTMDALGRSYHNYLEDWARAAFWWQKSNTNPLGLARCYWKLGNREMALEVLRRIGADNTGTGAVIKLWSDMGDLKTALSLAEAKARGGAPDAAYLAAGSACRQHGQYKAAMDYYQKVLAAPKASKENRERAQTGLDAVRILDALDLNRVADGTYKGGANGFRGNVEVEVVVAKSRIVSVKVTQHREDWAFTSITEVPRQIVEKQGIKGVDAVTGATISSTAIINATAKALADAMKP